MMFLLTLVYLVIGACLAYIAYRLWNNRKAGKQIKYFWLKLILSGWFALTFLIGGFNAGYSAIFGTNNESAKQNANQSSSSEEQSFSEESSSEDALEEDDDTDDHYSASTVKKINKQLKKDLTEDQKFATQGNEKYDYANYILKIEIQSNKTAYVWVDGSFTGLSEEARNTVAQRTNGLIGTSIVSAGVDYTPEEGQEGIYMSFWNGKIAIGHSRSDHSQFKWYK